MFHCRYLWLCLLAVLVSPLSALADGGKLVRIGVLSHRGDQFTLDKCSPTAEYLTSQICLTITSSSCRSTSLRWSRRWWRAKVDFVLVNSGIYVNLEGAVSRLTHLPP